MLELLLLWIYIGAFNAVIGLFVCKVLGRLLFPKGLQDAHRTFGLASLELAGVVAITIYAEAVSLFAPVGATAHLVLLAAGIAIAVICRKDLAAMIERLRPKTRNDWWQCILLCSLVVFTAFFACQGTQHTDTGIYHAQAIRWYEEYGAVKGLGNLQQHQAYNSASLAYAAFFSMKWLVGQSLHGTNGFLQAFLVIWSVNGLRGAWSRKRHLADGCRIAILLYAIVVSERIMSPATDFSSMYLVLWIVSLWVSNLQNNGQAASQCGEETDSQKALQQTKAKAQQDEMNAQQVQRTKARTQQDEEESVCRCGMLCLAIVCTATYKLSAGLLVIAALYPGIWLVRRKKWREIVVLLGTGIVILLPWLARNYMVSGWLLYPFTSIDVFQVDWKVPAEYAQFDSDQIKVYGRCLYDVSRVNDPMSAWLPVWWSEKTRPEMMLIVGNVLAAAGLLLGGLVCLHRRIVDDLNGLNGLKGLWLRRVPWDRFILYLAILGCIAGWFLTAPFIRYGLAFLLLLPCMVLGEWLRPISMGLIRMVTGWGMIAVFLCLSMYWDYYVLFDLTWIKQHLNTEFLTEHIVTQQDYDRTQVSEYEMEGGLTIYVPQAGSDNLSYYAFPGSAYLSMAERTKLRGTSIRDGFMARPE